MWGAPKKASKKIKRKAKQSSGDTDEELYTDVAKTEGDEEESVSDTREWLRFEEEKSLNYLYTKDPAAYGSI